MAPQAVQLQRFKSNEKPANGLQSDSRFHVFFGMPELGGTAMTFDRNAEIYGEGEPAEYVYRVVSGAVRTYRVLSDGRRQVSAFHLPGDTFGFSLGEDHTDSAEAVANSQIVFIRRSALLTAAQHNGDVTHKLLAITTQELCHAKNHSLLLIKSAQERLVAFLLEMAQRLASHGEMELPMSRQDIADYLGLTIETVSRTLSQLEEEGMIKVAMRRILFCNRSALNELNG